MVRTMVRTIDKSWPPAHPSASLFRNFNDRGAAEDPLGSTQEDEI